MKKIYKNKAVTISEVTITIVIFGLIAILMVAFLIYKNPIQQGNDTLSKKVSEEIDQSIMHMIIQESVTDDLTGLVDEKGKFSIADDNTEERTSKKFRKYVKDMGIKVDTTDEYFSKKLRANSTNFDKSLNDIYSYYFWTTNGVLIAYKFYNNCTSTSDMIIYPPDKRLYTIENICGTIFFDVNAFKGPNLLGSDQFVIPIGKSGIIYSD